MKKIIALCMAGIMLASVAGCSSETSKSSGAGRTGFICCQGK